MSILINHEARGMLIDYTLDGYQPVVCTYVGDQPLYYDIDFESEDSNG